ncbi:hypothetical protein COLO4_16769 [Corchorus olitorius]|uniref:Uncharacterized protein n=1 Tax=Corchorus olitorius TaxID=93759 RepID=A0A1R3JFP8_9ROSI|nr:hypothetical protein COLO4_16769 [Corchorus olitorius]
MLDYVHVSAKDRFGSQSPGPIRSDHHATQTSVKYKGPRKCTTTRGSEGKLTRIALNPLSLQADLSDPTK